MIQAESIPKYITDADCKLTLYQNCRNTINIAQTSLRLLGSDKKPRIINNSVLGENVDITVTANDAAKNSQSIKFVIVVLWTRRINFLLLMKKEFVHVVMSISNAL